MQTIHIKVDKKFATCTEEAIVANNTDWRVEFKLDSEWDDIDVKYCRFYYNDYHYDKQFVGTTCQAPTRHEHEENDGPEPYFIGIGLFSCDPAATDTDGDFLVTTMVYIKCNPSIKETGQPGAYSEEFKNQLYMTTESTPILIGESSETFNVEWQPSFGVSEGSLEINTASGNQQDIFNEVIIDLNTRELQTITVPFVITEGEGQSTHIVDEEWGKDYLFSYVLDYGYNCAFWWTYEINGIAYWKSPLVTTLDNGGRLSRQALQLTALQPTNIPEYKTKKELKLHIIATFGDNLMVGGKLRFVNVKVQEQEDTQDYIPHNIAQDNYIRTNSASTALHRWDHGAHTTLYSSCANESEWVLINPFYNPVESSRLAHYIYPSVGNSLFPQNGEVYGEWNLMGKVYNTSKKENIHITVTGWDEGIPYQLVTRGGAICYQNRVTIIDVNLDYQNPVSHGKVVELPEKFDYISIELGGGNDGNNAIIYEDLRLINMGAQGQAPIEYIINNEIASSNTRSDDILHTEQEAEL